MYKKIFSIFLFLMVFSMAFALAAEGDQGIAGVAFGSENGTRLQIQDGEHMGESGQMFKVQTQANNRIMFESEGVSAECDCEMVQEKSEGKTKLFVEMSNGQNSEVKIMPDAASEKALEKLKLNNCLEENSCQIELKEVGEGSEAKVAYELKTQRQSKVLGIFKAQMQVSAQVSAETGEVLRVNKPWWAFLASEPLEE